LLYDSNATKSYWGKICLRTKNPFKLLKKFELKRHPNIWKNEESKETKDFMEMEKGGVYCNKYDSHCIKTLTSKLPSMDF
jgi:hypothetical protein